MCRSVYIARRSDTPTSGRHHRHRRRHRRHRRHDQTPACRRRHRDQTLGSVARAAAHVRKGNHCHNAHTAHQICRAASPMRPSALNARTGSSETFDNFGSRRTCKARPQSGHLGARAFLGTSRTVGRTRQTGRAPTRPPNERTGTLSSDTPRQTDTAERRLHRLPARVPAAVPDQIPAARLRRLRRSRRPPLLGRVLPQLPTTSVAAAFAVRRPVEHR
jgi:hypothetical protein